MFTGEAKGMLGEIVEHAAPTTIGGRPYRASEPADESQSHDEADEGRLPNRATHATIAAPASEPLIGKDVDGETLIGKDERPVAAAVAEVRQELEQEMAAAEMESVKRRIRAGLKRKQSLIERLTSLQADLNLITTRMRAIEAALAKAEKENDPTDLPPDPLVVGAVLETIEVEIAKDARKDAREAEVTCPTCRIRERMREAMRRPRGGVGGGLLIN